MAATPPFFSHCGLEGPRDFAAFREQVEGYCCELSSAASDALSGSRVQHPDTGLHDLKACLDATATKFQIQFQLSQLAVYLAFDDAISASKAWKQIRAGCKVILRAIGPGLTFADLENCVRDLEKLRPDSSRFLTFMRLFVAVMCSSLAGAEALREVRFHRPLRHGIISTPIWAPQRSLRGLGNLLRNRTLRFQRPIAPELVRRFRLIRRRMGHDRLATAAEEWLRTTWPDSAPSLRKLERALVVNGPAWFKYPWVYAYYGIEGWRRKGHAAKNYSIVDSAIREQVSDYRREFFQLQPEQDLIERLPPVSKSRGR
jgi:hypothetical protein